MLDDLQRLTFNKGKRSNLTLEPIMLVGIKAMAVTELHTTVHSLELHDAKQTEQDKVKKFGPGSKGLRRSASSPRSAPAVMPRCASKRRWSSMSSS